MSKWINEWGLLDWLDELKAKDIQERVLEMSNRWLKMDQIRVIVEDIIVDNIPKVIN